MGMKVLITDLNHVQQCRSSDETTNFDVMDWKENLMERQTKQAFSVILLTTVMQNLSIQEVLLCT